MQDTPTTYSRGVLESISYASARKTSWRVVACRARIVLESRSNRARIAIVIGPYNTTSCVELKGEDLSCYSNKIESVSFRKCPYDH